MRIPAYTIEAGKDCFSHPLGGVAYLDIRRKCGGVLLALSKGFYKG
jgi:hypothetical protein